MNVGSSSGWLGRSWVQRLFVLLAVVCAACSAPSERSEQSGIGAARSLLVATTFSPSAAIQGAVVTLTGSGFTGTSAVAFNGVSATSFTVVSDTSITVTVPAGATTGKITVTTPSGVLTTTATFKVKPTL